MMFSAAEVELRWISAAEVEFIFLLFSVLICCNGCYFAASVISFVSVSFHYVQFISIIRSWLELVNMILVVGYVTSSI